ncbi:DUF3368 domain-containing protein [Candidatus Thiosymbion oneisti]
MAELRGLTPSARVVFDLLLQSDYRIGESVIDEVLRSVATTKTRGWRK